MVTTLSSNAPEEEEEVAIEAPEAVVDAGHDDPLNSAPEAAVDNPEEGEEKEEEATPPAPEQSGNGPAAQQAASFNLAPPPPGKEHETGPSTQGKIETENNTGRNIAVAAATVLALMVAGPIGLVMLAAMKKNKEEITFSKGEGKEEGKESSANEAAQETGAAKAGVLSRFAGWVARNEEGETRQAWKMKENFSNLGNWIAKNDKGETRAAWTGIATACANFAEGVSERFNKLRGRAESVDLDVLDPDQLYPEEDIAFQDESPEATRASSAPAELEERSGTIQGVMANLEEQLTTSSAPAALNPSSETAPDSPSTSSPSRSTVSSAPSRSSSAPTPGSARNSTPPLDEPHTERTAAKRADLEDTTNGLSVTGGHDADEAKRDAVHNVTGGHTADELQV